MATSRNQTAGKGEIPMTRKRMTPIALATALAALALLLFASAASADLTFCPPGEGAGQCAVPQHLNILRGLAFDSETGHLYVADNENNRIDVFAEDGSFLFAFGWKVNAASPEEKLQTCTTATGCQKGTPGAGAGQFNNPTSVAVDNDPASSSRHDLYVGEGANLRVQKFEPSGEFIWTVGKGVDKTEGANLCARASGHTCGAGAEGEVEGTFASQPFVAAGPGGALYALDRIHVPGPGEVHQLRLQRFEASGAPIPSQAILFEGQGAAIGLAVDAAGDAWVSGEGGAAGLSKYSPGGALLAGPIDTQIEFRSALTIDPSGDVYAGQSIGTLNVVSAYGPAGNVLRRFAYTTNRDFGQINGLAAHSGPFGDVAISEAAKEAPTRIRYVPLPPPGPIAVAATVEAPPAGIGSTKATVVAEVNPEGKPTEVHFEYLTQEAYAGQGDSFEGPATKSTPTVSLGAEGFSLKLAEATLGCPDPATEASQPGNDCLTPQTEYRYRVVATNADGGGEGTAEGEPFTTAEPLEFGATYASEVSTDVARIQAEVNPHAVHATGYFEYVTDAQFQKSGFADAAKAPDVDHGASPLDFGSGEALVTRGTLLSPLATGTVYHYRLVATDPLIEPIIGEEELLRTFQAPSPGSCAANEASRLGVGGFLPDCRAYEMVSPVDKAGGDIRALNNTLNFPGVLEQSALSGERLAYGSIRAFGDALSAPLNTQYIAQRVADSGWQTHAISPPRGQPVVSTISEFESEFKFFSPDLCQAWLATQAEPPLGPGAVAGYPNLYQRSDRLCGSETYGALAPRTAPHISAGQEFKLELQGVSADGAAAIFASRGKLASGAAEKPIQLYVSAAGAPLRLVCVLPDGTPVSGACNAGSGFFFDDLPVGVNVTGAVSADGSRIFWEQGGEEGKLYLREHATQPQSALDGAGHCTEATKACTVPVSEAAEEEEGTSESFFWGAAQSGARAIFTTGHVPIANPTGEASLYSFESDGGLTHRIATGVYAVMGISEDARRVYFASKRALTGEAPDEANSEGAFSVEGEPNLYLYEAGENGGRTVFIATLSAKDIVQEELSPLTRKPFRHSARISPDGLHAAFTSFGSPTGYDNRDAATGEADREVYLYDAGARKLICASCNPSGARPDGIFDENFYGPSFAAGIPGSETILHAARFLGDDGARLYFESADALLPRDTNGRIDVYQWEQPGTGTCSPGSSSYSAQDQGCVDLISSGQSPVDSRFVEADPSGRNVFFATLSSLLPQDPGLIDIYDARQSGGLPIPQSPPPGCEGEACQPPPPPPDDPTPASSAFQGAGNVHEAPGKCPKGKIRKHGKCVRKKHKARHHKRAHHRRANHNRRATR